MESKLPEFKTSPFRIKDISATLEWSWDVIHDTCYGF
ncbi:unnamed protein product [Oikopleura dioica]|uniref:Uncharacterized protein n=1 Tax=Oikopleura dioica TaxID=34765 RepID=E4X8Q2_OIKDI|nr:unnamed protein product [Oikopleura dioica]